MSYSEAMAKHYQDKRASKAVSHQPKYSNTYELSNGATIYSNGKLNDTIIARVKEIGDKCNYFIDSPIYTDEYMKSFNKKIADAKTVDELATYLGELDEEIEVLHLHSHDATGLECQQFTLVLSDGILLKTCFYI